MKHYKINDGLHTYKVSKHMQQF